MTKTAFDDMKESMVGNLYRDELAGRVSTLLIEEIKHPSGRTSWNPGEPIVAQDLTRGERSYWRLEDTAYMKKIAYRDLTQQEAQNLAFYEKE
tara:strand:+ start:130 stop:408 length:279 start_codon:yes stop_codon:yes gene_type:complete